MKQLIYKPQLLRLIILITILLLPTLTIAQDDLPCGGEDPYATECPLDEWLSMLLVAGVIYGAYAIHRSKKKKEINDLEQEVNIKNIVLPL